MSTGEKLIPVNCFDGTLLSVLCVWDVGWRWYTDAHNTVASSAMEKFFNFAKSKSDTHAFIIYDYSSFVVLKAVWANYYETFSLSCTSWGRGTFFHELIFIEEVSQAIKKYAACCSHSFMTSATCYRAILFLSRWILFFMCIEEHVYLVMLLWQ